MTDQEKAAFLRSEGWKFRAASKCWIDPVDPRWGYSAIEQAFAIASRRKSDRDTRRLKAAGWRYFSGAWWHTNITQRLATAWVNGGVTCEVPHAKSEALKLLEAGNE